MTTGDIDIPGDFTAQGAQDFAVMLKSGPLPATLTTVEERTIEPGLGNENDALQHHCLHCRRYFRCRADDRLL